MALGSVRMVGHLVGLLVGPLFVYVYVTFSEKVVSLFVLVVSLFVFVVSLFVIVVTLFVIVVTLLVIICCFASVVLIPSVVVILIALFQSFQMIAVPGVGVMCASMRTCLAGGYLRLGLELGLGNAIL